MRKSLGVDVITLQSAQPLSGGEASMLSTDKPATEEELRLKGKLYIVASIASKAEFGAAELLQAAVATVKKDYYENSEDGVLRSLEKAIKQAYGKAKTILSEKVSLSEGADFDLAAAVLWGNVLYIGQLGNSRAGIIREGQLNMLNENASQKEDSGDNGPIRLLSGLVRERDFLILATPLFWETFSPQKLESYFLSYSLEQAGVLLREKIEEHPKNQLLGGLVLSFQIKIFPTEEEMMTIVPPQNERNMLGRTSPLVTRNRLGLAELKSKILPRFSFPRTIKKPFLKLLKREPLVPSYTGRINSDLPIRSEKIKTTVKKTPVILSTIGEKLSPVKSLMANVLGRVKLFRKTVESSKSPDVFLKDPLMGNSKKILIIVGILFTVLSLSVFLTLRSRGTVRKNEEFVRLKSQIESNITEAQRISLSDEQKTAKLTEANGLIASVETLSLTEAEKQTIVDLKRRIDYILYDVTLVTTARVLYELQNGDSASITLKDGNAFVPDPTGKLLRIITLSDGSSDEYPYPSNEIGIPRFITDTDDGIYLLDPQKGVSKFDTQSHEFSLIIESDTTWANASDFQNFGNFLYILLSGQNKLLKFVPTANGYSNGTSYITDESSIENSIGLAIDGSIYILNRDGTVLQYASGRKRDFNVHGFNWGFKKPEAIFTDYSEMKAINLYILDSERKAVIVFDKEGDYQKAYHSPDWNNVSSLWVDEEHGKLYLLQENKILEVPVQ